MSLPEQRLSSFFHPERVAIIGASETGMYPAGILQNLQAFGFKGDIYPVNPNRTEVFGHPCYPDILHTPHRPDLAVITIPRDGVITALRQCLAVGTPAACIISAGFGEADEHGKELQKEMQCLIKGSRGGSSTRPLTVIGPNCAGLANIPDHLAATRLPVTPRSGNVSFTSQSGALMMALFGVFVDRGVGLNLLVSLGNQVDVTLADTLVYLAGDLRTEVVAGFLESFEDGSRFVEGARTLLLAGKPLVLIKSGRTAVGQQAAATHTGAMAGSDRVFSAVCRQFGVILVDDMHELVNTALLMSVFGKKLAVALQAAVVTQSGGLGSFTADLCTQNDLGLPALSQDLQNQLLGMPHLLSFGGMSNPADVRGAGVTGCKIALTLAPFMEDKQTNLVLVLLARQMDRQEDHETAQALVEITRKFDKPLAVVWVGGRRFTLSGNPADKILLEAGVPVFEQPGDCVQALGRAARYWHFRQAWMQDGENPYVQ